MWQDPAGQSADWPRASPLSGRTAYLVNQSSENAAAGARNRMSQRDGAAIGIQPLAIEMQIAVAGQHLRGKGFVQFDRVVIFHLRARALAQAAHCGHRADAHHARIDRRNRSVHDPRDRFQIQLANFFLAREHHRRRAVRDAARIPRAHAAALAEHWRQLRERLERHVPRARAHLFRAA